VIGALKLDVIPLFGILFRCFAMNLVTAFEPVLALVSADWGRQFGHLLVKLN
jgi:hypothetical protein